ncbi:HNH endonuclease [Saccharomonospora saliphila]|uniref:HNH endonuclease n=1 Tax=Saccharomonospora saliphila TaxID=369829 RepID=UPI00039CED76|nr:HNH endonuclease [Saccharomonospora saliphila]
MGDITRAAVLRAIAEYDELGRAEFLTKYGFGEARSYVLVKDGRRYDSKAVAGVAHQWTQGRALRPDEFSGGLGAAVKWLTELDFLVEGIAAEAATWGLVCNPKLFDIDQLRRDGKSLESWKVTRFKGEIAPGDRFILWRSGNGGGVMAYGRITGKLRSEGLTNNGYWLEKPPPADYVPLAVDEWVDPVIPRNELIKDPRVSSTSLIQQPWAGLPHRLTGDTWTAVMEAVSSADAGSGETDPGLRPDTPGRAATTVQRVVRSSGVVRLVKEWHAHRCQICALRIELPGGAYYSEGAHIHAVGAPYNGPDVTSNVLCLCPNCHIMFDNGAIVLDDELTIIRHGHAVGFLRTDERHAIDPDYVRSHRERWQR